MDKKLYIAYGSNLSVGQMARRCPGAKIVGKAMLQDWKLAFKVHATIEPCPGMEVPVLIWEIGPSDEASLDLYEGFPSYYFKKELEVTMTTLKGRNPRKAKAMAYIMSGGHSPQLPTKFYLDVLVEGYERFGFSLEHLRQALRETREAEEIYWGGGKG